MDGGCTGANGTNPIASLRSRNISFATLHSAQKWYSTAPLRSGLVPLAPVGLPWIGSCPNGSRRVLSPTKPETKMRNDGEYRNEEGTRLGSSF